MPQVQNRAGLDTLGEARRIVSLVVSMEEQERKGAESLVARAPRRNPRMHDKNSFKEFPSRHTVKAHTTTTLQA